jgi:hypothetical protein
MTSEQKQTWIDGLTVNRIETIADTHYPIHLGRVYSGSSRQSENQEQLVKDLDGLLNLFDIDSEKWPDQVVDGGGHFTTLIGATGYRPYEKSEIKRMAVGQNLGQFILGRSLLAVPIEGDEDMYGDFNLTLNLNPKVFGLISSHGEQEIYRHYIDPKTGERVSGEIEDLEEKAVTGELDTDIAEIHTDIVYHIQFKSSLDKAV